LVVDPQSTTSQHKSPPVRHAARRASFVFADFLWRLNKKSGAARGRNPAILILLCAPKLIQQINVLCDPSAIFAAESRSHKAQEKGITPLDPPLT